MQMHKNILRRAASFVVATLLAGVAAGTASGTEWMARAGAQTPDKGNQVLAFLPNELWIYVGDSIRWTFRTDEFHTVTFLKPGQTRPPLNSPTTGTFMGCPGTTPDGSNVDNSTCVTSGTGTTGQTYSVNFPSTGNFKLVCLVHTRMTGAIHVLPLGGRFHTTRLSMTFRETSRKPSCWRKAISSRFSERPPRGNQSQTR